jgi:hypothetical protein
VGNVTYLEEFRAAGHDDTCTDQQKQADLDPNKFVDHAVDICQLFKKLIHASSKIKNSGPRNTDHSKKQNIPPLKDGNSFVLLPERLARVRFAPSAPN